MELWARAQKPQLPGWGGPRGASGLMEAHPTRLWGMPPGTKPNAEDSTANINELGIRGKLPDRPRPSGRQRIMTLGDSAFFGFGVSDHQVFTAQLGSILRKQGLDADAVNAGISGYSIAQHRVLLDEFGWDLDPTLLVLCNVWSDNTWDTFQDEDLIASRRFAAQNPLTRSALVKLAAVWLTNQQSDDGGRVIVWNSAGEWPEGKNRRVPLDRWIKLTDGVIRDAADRGIGILILKPTNSFLLEGLHNGPDPGWQPYFDAMDALAKHHDVPLLDVTEVYAQAIAEGRSVQDLLWDKMHPSETGHKVLAQAIAEKLGEVGWPENRLLAKLDPFDGSKFEDLPQPQWTDDAGAGSPQQNLFELSDEHKAQIAATSKRMSEEMAAGMAGPGERLAPTDGQPMSPNEAGPQNRTPARMAWAVGMDISGGNPPYSVRLMDADGRTIGSARVGKSGPVRLNVRGEVSTVTAMVTDGDGNTTQAKATPSAANVSLRLGR